METKTFQEMRIAASWARTHAREHCYPHQFWRVEEKAPAEFVIAVRSKVSGELHHFVPKEG